LLLGLDDGTSLGSSDGVSLGLEVGTSLGSSDGRPLGMDVGTSLGSSDGLLLGAVDGRRLGRLEGADVKHELEHGVAGQTISPQSVHNFLASHWLAIGSH
jgi:hypothetical protein